MAISWQTPGAIAYSAASGSTVTPAYPASSAEGDKLVLIVGQKPATANGGGVTTPTDWTLITSITGAGGYGATLGADTGNTNIYAYERTVPSGGLSGTLSVALSNNNVAWAQIMRLTKTRAAWAAGAGANGQDTTGGNVSIAFGSDPGVAGDDYVIGAMCIPTDVSTPSQFSAQAFTQTGVTFGTVTEVSEPDRTNGNDIGGMICRAPVSSGTSSAAPTMTATAGGTTTNVRGGGLFIRLREAIVTINVSQDEAATATDTTGIESAANLSFVQTIISSANINATSLGAQDWKAFINNSPTLSERKSGGGNIISELTTIGTPVFTGGFTGGARQVSWTDGVPTTSGNNNGGVYYDGLNAGGSFTIPAGVGNRTAKIASGYYSGTARVTCTLSDGSAPPISYTFPSTGSGIDSSVLIEISYNSENAGQTVLVEWQCIADLGDGGVYHSLVWVSPESASGIVIDADLTEATTAADATDALKTQNAANTEAASATDSQANTAQFVASSIEAATAVDANAANFTTQSAVSESATATDVQAAANVSTQAIAESATATDSSTRTKVAVAASTEAISAADANSSIKTTSATNSESAAAVDSSNKTVITNSTIAESATATDSNVGSAASSRSVNESITATDSNAAAKTAIAILAESSTALDVQSAIQTLLAAMAESATAQDTQSIGAQTHNVGQLETAAASDQYNKSVVFVCLQSESGAAADQVQSSKIAGAAVVEVATATDTQGQGSFSTADQLESASATDLAANTLIRIATVNEIASAQDLTGASAVLFSSLLESLAAIDQQAASEFIFSAIIESLDATDTVVDLSQQIINAEITETGFALDVVFVDELEYDGRYTVQKPAGNYIAKVSVNYVASKDGSNFTVKRN